MHPKRYSKYFPAIFLIVDLVFLNIGFLTANFLKFDTVWFEAYHYPEFFVFLNITWFLVFISNKLGRIERDNSIREHISKLIFALVISEACVFAMWATTKSYFYSREHLFYTYLIFGSSVFLWRVLLIKFLRYYRAKGYNVRNVIVVGYGPIGRNLKRYFQSHLELGYNFHGFFDDKSDGSAVIGALDDVPNYVKDKGIDIIFCALPKLYEEDVRKVIDFAENNLVNIKLISQFSKMRNEKFAIEKYGSIPILNLSTIPLDNVVNRFVKRTFDLVICTLAFVFIFSWLFPLVAVLIKIDSKGPIFFVQKRHGKGNKFFNCWKFRSMVENKESDHKQAQKDDPRVTKVGAFLRKTSIDELPQFINVLLGSMSLVGPRPHPISLNDIYSDQIDRFIQRHAVKPGITGLAQAKGYRGETKEYSSMYGRVKLDKFYVKKWSLIFDIKIMVMTVYSMMSKNENAY